MSWPIICSIKLTDYGSGMVSWEQHDNARLVTTFDWLSDMHWKHTHCDLCHDTQHESSANVRQRKWLYLLAPASTGQLAVICVSVQLTHGGERKWPLVADDNFKGVSWMKTLLSWIINPLLYDAWIWHKVNNMLLRKPNIGNVGLSIWQLCRHWCQNDSLQCNLWRQSCHVWRRKRL